MEPGVYLFKEELWKEHNIPDSQWRKRKEDLLLWISNFYDYELLEGKPIRIKINEVIGNYQPLPRKTYDNQQREKAVKEAKIDYADFTIASLRISFKPNSKSKIAREAIYEFGNKNITILILNGYLENILKNLLKLMLKLIIKVFGYFS